MATKFVQVQPFTLAGSGAILGDVTLTLSTFTQIDGTLLTMTDFGDKGYGTLSPGNGTQELPITFTGVVQNSNGTATLTGVKSQLTISPYTETTGLAQSYTGGTVFVISNTAGFYEALDASANDEIITGDWAFANHSPTVPTESSSAIHRAASIEYINNAVTAGAPDASATVKGITKLSSNPSVSTNPVALNSEEVSVTPGANVVPREDASGHLPAAVGGAANTLATLNGSSKVVQDPANLTTTATNGKIPQYNATPSIDVAITPVNATDAASKSYIDTGLAGKLNTFGSWDSSSYSVNNVYQSPSDGMVIGTSTYTGGGTSGTNLVLKTDSANPPTVIRSALDKAVGAGETISVISPVKKNDYFSVSYSTSGGPDTTHIYFLPL